MNGPQTGVHEDSPPPCNCPRHFGKPSQKHLPKISSQEASSQTLSKKARNRLKTSEADVIGKIVHSFTYFYMSTLLVYKIRLPKFTALNMARKCHQRASFSIENFFVLRITLLEA